MNITRESIEQIAKENDITTIQKLLIHLDHREFFELINDKSNELKNGIFRFRYEDRKESLNIYRKELYDKMIAEGKYLDRNRCGIIDKKENNKKYICHYYSECEHQNHNLNLYTIICMWEHAEDCKYCKVKE